MSVPSVSLCGTFLYFDKTLRRCCSHPVLALGYRFTGSPHDSWTHKFNAFKFGGSDAERSAALNGAVNALTAGLGALTFPSPPIGVVCVHGHAATGLEPLSQVAMLAYNVARNVGFKWCGDYVTKLQHRALKTIRDADERDGEVANKYTSAVLPNGLKTIIVVDDFTTRGATIGEVARAVVAANPGKAVYGLVLAKNESPSYYQSVMNADLTNAHIQPQVAAKWP